MSETRPSASSTMVTNALTVDVEDYYHVSAFEPVVGYANWHSYPSRVEANTNKVLQILGECGIRATFFVLGWVAERFPSVVRAIHATGHEIATHGYAHRLIYDQTPDEFRLDVQRSLDVIQDIIGERVLGYRAPSFSITARSLWAIAVLESCSLRYDSSIFPTRPLVHRRYGLPGVPKHPYEIRPGFWEFPMATIRFIGRDFPVGGGGWLRAYPYSITREAIRRINASGRPALVYLHPWELDPDQPRLSSTRWRQFLHYRNLRTTASKLAALCRDFRFGAVRDVLNLKD